MIRSMTGYAVRSRDLGHATLHLELKSVNARFLDVSFRIGDELRQCEMPLRELLGGRLQRGKVELRAHLQPNGGGALEMHANAAVLAQLAQLQQEVQRTLRDAATLSVSEVLRWPGVLADQAGNAEELLKDCLALAGAALDELVASRQREGAKLAALVGERTGRMRELLRGVAPLLPRALADYQERLAAKLREALASLDEERIRQEVGLFANRVDVAEEIGRLGAHLDEVDRVLEKGGAAGKRLDFLMQELNREANTLASKSVSGEVTGVALELKLLIEQMREQVQNIE